MLRFFRRLVNLLVLAGFVVGTSRFLQTGGGSSPASEQIEKSPAAETGGGSSPSPASEQIEKAPAAETGVRRFFRRLGNLLVLAAFVVGTSFFLQTSGGSSPSPSPASEQIEQAPAAETGGGWSPASEQIEEPPAAELPAAALSAPPPVAPVATTTPIAPVATAAPTPEPRLPITGLAIASVHLETDVVAAPLVESNGVWTWQVPAFVAGHAEDTAGAGQRGNAVLMGHVSSLRSGDVFKNLDRVQVGDEIDVFSAGRHFLYRVYETRSVSRTDLTMVEPTSEPIISVFTCIGAWDPIAWDFTQRFFVRARLVTG